MGHPESLRFGITSPNSASDFVAAFPNRVTSLDRHICGGISASRKEPDIHNSKNLKGKHIRNST
jgi:hypothetical protein